MKVLLALTLCVCVALAVEIDPLLGKFSEFRERFGKKYATPEEQAKRFEIFKQNVARAEELQRNEEGTATYGITKFSDLTPEEFSQMYLMSNEVLANPASRYHLAPLVELPNVTLPADGMDWRDKGAVTKVYNQAQCGSCWAFSATETVESYWHLCGHELVSLSPQQIVDCDRTSYGCNGGWTEHAYDYLIKTSHGQETLADYPYTARDGTCRFNSNMVKAKIASWSYVTKTKDENAMTKWLADKGPLSVCVDASTWSSYTGGVVKSCGRSLNHCVQVTGWSTVNGVPAWHVRNSWGTDWGYSGYMYVAIGSDVCGIAEDVTVVTCA